MRTIFLLGPYLSIEKSFKIEGYRNFHDNPREKEVPRFIIFIFCLNIFESIIV